jgi:3'-phosphoadenosine 5'-phosphosulfate sulfotransferase (PAPS reductase)/FAD synthetase
MLDDSTTDATTAHCNISTFAHASAEPDFDTVDLWVVAFSGGKDSLACLLYLLKRGVPREKIELWHHDVDGREGSDLMDWPCTRAYCRAVAAAFGVPIYFSWKAGGFEREMLRKDQATAPILYEVPGGRVQTSGGRGKSNTRRLFPQVSPNLSVRWCSSYLKIDVCAASIRGQERFEGKYTVVVTGERAEESAARARYKLIEPHRSDLRAGKKSRRVDQWRPVHGWSERQVWDIIREYGVNPHPAYRLGWGRVSCMKCIFGNADQWASVRAIDPAGFSRVAAYEAEFGKTIQRKLSVVQQADRGRPYGNWVDVDLRAALSHEFNEPVVLMPDEWTLPAGAFGDSCGPT